MCDLKWPKETKDTLVYYLKDLNLALLLLQIFIRLIFR